MMIVMAILIFLTGCMTPVYPGLLYDLAHEPYEANNCLAKARRYRECFDILGVDAFIRVAENHAVVIICQPNGTYLMADPTTGQVCKWKP